MDTESKTRSAGDHGSGVLILLAILAAVPAIQVAGAGDAAATVLASVGGRTITVEEFKAEVVRKVRGAPARFRGEDDLRRFLEEMVRVEAVAAAAREAGYPERLEVKRAVAQLLAARYEADLLEPRLAALVVADEEIKNYHQEHPEEFRVPRRIRGAVIRIDVSRKADARTRAERKERAGRALEEARLLPRDAPGFGTVAVSFSEDQATRYRGGDTGWLTAAEAEARWGAAAAGALFVLRNPGDLGPVVETPDGFILVKLLEEKPADVRPLAEVQEPLRRRLLMRKQEAEAETFYRDVARRVTVQVNRELLERLLPEIQQQAQAGERALQPPPLPQTSPQAPVDPAQPAEQREKP